MAKNTSSRLGRGLGSLISKGSSSQPKASNSEEKTGGAPVSPNKTPATSTDPKTEAAKVKVTNNNEPKSPFREIPIELVEPNPYQPRMTMDDATVKELSESIQSEGLLQPIVVRERGGKYELIAGERRWRASKLLKKDKITARVISATDASSAVISLVENLQRENLNPIDEAMGYASLMRDFDLTQEQVATRVGKARASIANALRLVSLEEEIQAFIAKGILSTGHAKVLLGLEPGQRRLILARKIIEAGLSVREAEKLIQHAKSGAPSGSSTSKPVPQDTIIRDLEKRVGSHLNTRVSFQHSPKKGRLIIEYRGNDDLNRILNKIGYLDEAIN